MCPLKSILNTGMEWCCSTLKASVKTNWPFLVKGPRYVKWCAGISYRKFRGLVRHMANPKGPDWLIEMPRSHTAEHNQSTSSYNHQTQDIHLSKVPNWSSHHHPRCSAHPKVAGGCRCCSRRSAAGAHRSRCHWPGRGLSCCPGRESLPRPGPHIPSTRWGFTRSFAKLV